MKSKYMLIIFAVSLVAFPLVYVAILVAGSGEASDGSARIFSQVLLKSTLAVEIIAFVQIIRARALFSKGDVGRVTWTLIACFLFVRILAEAYFQSGMFNLVGLNLFIYTFTFSDLIFIAALVTTIRAYKGTGLNFEIKPLDYFYIASAWAIAIITFIVAYRLGQATDLGFRIGYRVVAVAVGSVILSSGLVVRRYVSQMGGGAVARVWNWVVVASFARDLSLLAGTLIWLWSQRSTSIGSPSFIESYLLWIFACCWVLAATFQQEIIPRAAMMREEASPA